MTNQLTTTAKQAGLELIGMSDAFAQSMQRWDEVLSENPDSETAAFSAGFVTKPSAASAFEMVTDVQTPPDGPAVLRTWAIETKTGADQKECFNGIQLTFEVDAQQAARLVAQGGSITREGISNLLKNGASQLSRISVSDKSGGDDTKQTHGERYDFTAAELGEYPADSAKVEQVLQTVLQNLKHSLADKR